MMKIKENIDQINSAKKELCDNIIKLNFSDIYTKVQILRNIDELKEKIKRLKNGEDQNNIKPWPKLSFEEILKNFNNISNGED